MKRCLLVFVLAFIWSTNLNAQVRFSFSGYAVDIPIFQFYGNEVSEYYGINSNQFLNLSRVRLRPSIELWKNSRLEAEYEIDALYFDTLSNLEMSSYGKTNRQLVDLRWIPVNDKRFKVIHFIDRLYWWQGFKKASVVIGRQRISWGTGRIWNPTDLFNPINPASYYKAEKDGADAVSFKYSFGDFTDLNLVFNPQKKLKDSNYGFRFRTNYAEYDFSVMGGCFDNRLVGGLDFAGNLFDAGVRGEGICSVNKDSVKDNFIKFILGADNQFTPELYGLVEYHYNGEGKTDKAEYDLQRLARGEIQNLSKNYICLSAVYQVTPLASITFTDITNLTDKSGFINFICSYSAKENFYLYLGTQFTYGDESSEYWYYPFSLYLQGEYYF